MLFLPWVARAAPAGLGHRRRGGGGPSSRWRLRMVQGKVRVALQAALPYAEVVKEAVSLQLKGRPSLGRSRADIQQTSILELLETPDGDRIARILGDFDKRGTREYDEARRDLAKLVSRVIDRHRPRRIHGQVVRERAG